MKKNVFSFVIICFLVTVWTCAVACTMYDKAKTAEQYTTRFYPLSTSVYHVSYATDTVTVIDGLGNLWQFKGAEDWAIKDICACLMDSNNTPDISDDTIVKVRYSGSWGCGE